MSTHGLTPTMLTALRAMPVVCGDAGYLPAGAPHGNTLTALRVRGLVSWDGITRSWTRTDAGYRLLIDNDERRARA